MTASPTGFQIAFLLFALHFFAMLAARSLASVLPWPAEHFNTLGLLIVMPLELALVLGLPNVRRIVLDQLARPLDVHARAEAVAVSLVKVALAFGVWGAVAIWALYAAHKPDVFSSLGFIEDRNAMDRFYFSAWGILRAVLAISLIPIAEEIVFRGVLFRLWERQWGWVAAMLLSSAAFAAVHPHNLIQTFLSSIFYVCLLRRTGSLWAPILCHATYNFLITWPLFGQLLMLKSRESAATLEGWWVHLVCLVFATVALAVYVWLARRPAPIR